MAKVPKVTKEPKQKEKHPIDIHLMAHGASLEKVKGRLRREIGAHIKTCETCQRKVSHAHSHGYDRYPHPTLTDVEAFVFRPKELSIELRRRITVLVQRDQCPWCRQHLKTALAKIPAHIELKKAQKEDEGSGPDPEFEEAAE